jgi:hypothetical protein
MVKGIPLAFAPGTDVARSATNFLLLALIVARTSMLAGCRRPLG